MLVEWSNELGLQLLAFSVNFLVRNAVILDLALAVRGLGLRAVVLMEDPIAQIQS